MNSIYKTFWGKYIDLDKLISAEYFNLEMDGSAKIVLEFQKNKKPLIYEYHGYNDLYEEKGRIIPYPLSYSEKSEFYNKSQSDPENFKIKSWYMGIIYEHDDEVNFKELFENVFNNFIKDWETYKSENK